MLPRRHFAPDPEFVLGEESLGHQRSSMRPSSARYSFARSARSTPSVRQASEGPGPAAYVPPPSTASAAFFGTGPQITGPLRPTTCFDGAVGPADCAEAVQPKSARAVFGREERGGAIVDPEVVRMCPETQYLRESPGLVYNPDFRKLSGSRGRPQSAPSYSIRGRCSQTRSQELSTPETVAPNSYRPRVAAIGVQYESKRRTGRCSSFGRASRFPSTREAEGQLSAECSAASLPGPNGRRQHRAPSAHFGSASRECSARARPCRPQADRPPSANLGPPRLPHPLVAPHREIVRWS